MENTQNLKSLHWDITNKCNLRCNHCYNANKYFDKKSSEYISAHLTLEEAKNIVDKFYSKGFRHIHLLGGEPLAAENLFEIIRYIKHYNMVLTINSNATLLDDKMQDMLINLGVDQFAASLDGASKEINDRVRGEGTFDLVCRNMIEFNKKIKQRSAPIETVLVFTLTKANINDLIKMPELASQLGIDLITFTVFLTTGNGKKNKNDFYIDVKSTYQKVEEMLEENAKNERIPIQIDTRPLICDYYANKYNSAILFNKKNSLCSAGETVWYLEADGGINPCLGYQLDWGKSFFKNKGIEREKLYIQSEEIEDIQKSTYWRKFLEYKHLINSQKIKTCVGCPFDEVCEPCFLEYENKSRVPECEYIKECICKDFKNIGKKKLIISNDVEFTENTIKKKGKDILIFNNSMTKIFLENIKNGSTFEELYNMIYKEYAVDEVWLKYDICKFIYKLVNNNIAYLNY